MAWVPETRTGLRYRYLMGTSIGTGIGHLHHTCTRTHTHVYSFIYLAIFLKHTAVKTTVKQSLKSRQNEVKKSPHLTLTSNHPPLLYHASSNK